jgi:hypothetical protein
MDVVDTYIVRVYRRDPLEARQFSGLVEIVASGGKKAFADGVELLEILSKEFASSQMSPRRNPLGRTL